MFAASVAGEGRSLMCQWFFDFDVSGDRFHCTIFRIDPKGM